MLLLTADYGQSLEHTDLFMGLKVYQCFDFEL